VNTNAEIIDWMVDEFEKTAGKADKGSFTGKSMANGGSEGRPAATGRGGVITLVEYLKAKGMIDQPLTVALQGFGNVGYYFAEVLRAYPHITLIAVSNSQNTWVQPSGIDVTNTVGEVKGTPRPEQLANLQTVTPQAASDIISVKADILVLGALEDAVTEHNAGEVQSKLIVELANGPVTTPGEEILEKANVTILPDIIANAGGVIVSCFEWQQNVAGEHWVEADVNTKLQAYLEKATKEMITRSEAQAITLRQSAFELAIERLV